MGVWLCVAGICVVCFCFPYIRCLFKRLSLFSKIKNVCKEKGYRLQGTHSFWYLGGKNGKRCNCIIETTEEIFAIKLFGVPRRRRVLVFTENKEYFKRILVGALLLIHEAFDGKAKRFPEYDFTLADKMTAGEKKLRKILLVNPVPMEMLYQKERGTENKLSAFPMENVIKDNDKECVLNPGDELYGLEVANLSWLVKELKK